MKKIKMITYFLMLGAIVSLLASTANAQTQVFYEMNEGAGTAVADSSGFGRDATINAFLDSQPNPVWVPGHTGAAGDFGVHFDQEVSANPMIEWANLGDPIQMTDGGSFTVEAQLKPDGFAADEYIFSIGTGLGTTVNLRWSPTVAGNQTSLDRVIVGVGNTDVGSILLSDQIVAGQWQNLSLVYTATGATSTFEILRDNSLSGSLAWGSQIGSDPLEFQIGHTPSNIWYRSYRGDVDDFKITAVPEPATMSLLALGGLLSFCRKSRKG